MIGFYNSTWSSWVRILYMIMWKKNKQVGCPLINWSNILPILFCLTRLRTRSPYSVPPTLILINMGWRRDLFWLHSLVLTQKERYQCLVVVPVILLLYFFCLTYLLQLFTKQNWEPSYNRYVTNITQLTFHSLLTQSSKTFNNFLKANTQKWQKKN